LGCTCLFKILTRLSHRHASQLFLPRSVAQPEDALPELVISGGPGKEELGRWPLTVNAVLAAAHWSSMKHQESDTQRH